MIVKITNFLEPKITEEARLWECLGGIIEIRLSKAGRPNLIVDCTLPWAGVPDYMKRRKG